MIAQWIRGSGEKAISNLSASGQLTFGCGREFAHSLETWRSLIRQSWLKGLLDRVLSVGGGCNTFSSVAFATYRVSQRGEAFLSSEGEEIMLPALEKKECPKSKKSTPGSSSMFKVRKGKGCHALTVIRHLISLADNWFPIVNSDDYNFPGVFDVPYPQRLGYCEDISKLQNFEKSDPHFIFSDIQLGKGKARPKRVITLDVDGKAETVCYRIVPCGGVKVCGNHTEGCPYVAPTFSTKPCSKHPKTPLQRSGECTVEFVYIWPVNETDNRRWLTGITRSGKLQPDNLHNHPLHKEMKIPVRVDSDIRRAVIENPHLKPSDLSVGKGMQYMPGAASLAATNRTRIKNIRLNTLKETQSTVDPRSAVLDLEKDALKYDNSMRERVESKQLESYSCVGHPYVRKYGIKEDFTWVLTMSPLMSELLSNTDCIEVDITYRSAVELQYLFNAVAFNYCTMKWMVVAHIRMNCIDAEAYAQCFRAMFEVVAGDHPTFKVGESLTGVIADWADQQAKGLEIAVGKSLSDEMLKGCQVHFIRSVQRVAKKVNPRDSKRRDAFTAIGQKILKADSAEDILKLFEVLKGERPLNDATDLMPNEKIIAECTVEQGEWQIAATWVEWWMRKQHLRMLSHHFSTMSKEQFQRLPSTTNAVESHNRLSKTGKPEILRIAMLTTYKVDMAMALVHMAAREGIQTGYRYNSSKKQQKRERTDHDDEGPPDKSSDFDRKPKREKKEAISKKTRSKKGKFEFIDDDNSDFEGNLNRKSMWIASLKLQMKGKEVIEKGEWLDDSIISAAQQLLHKQFPLIDGFQHTTKIASGTADILRGGAIQILHVRSNHWVCLAVEEDKSGVKLFDSLYPDIPLPTIDTIISLLHPLKDQIEIRSMKMQEQAGVSDCGVLTIAVATSICFGEDPTVVRWEQARMRAHLVQCLEAETMTPFPKNANMIGEQGGTNIVIMQAIHCICRRRQKKREKVTQCGKCKKLFHNKCIKPRINLITWNCDSCMK